MFCQAADGQPFDASGELRLAGAHIGGQLSFTEARLRKRMSESSWNFGGGLRWILIVRQ